MSEKDIAWKELRRKVLDRDGNKCTMCGDDRDLQAHHIIYRSRGGKDKMANLTTLCQNCHCLVHRHDAKSRRKVG